MAADDGLSEQEAILHCLREGRCTPSKLAHDLDRPQRRVTRQLRELQAAGRVEQVHPGLYELAEDERERPSSELPFVLQAWVSAEDPDPEALDRARKAFAMVDAQAPSTSAQRAAEWEFMSWLRRYRDDGGGLPTDTELRVQVSRLLNRAHTQPQE